MKFYPVVILSLFSFILSTGINSVANDETKVAGRTLEGWVKDLASDNEIVRLRAVKSLGPFKDAAIPALIQCLDDPSDAVKYWAADHLGQNGKSVSKSDSAKKAIGKLKELQTRKGKAIEMAASFALCQIEGSQKNIQILVSRLNHPERGMACSAAEFLGKMKANAVAALPELEKHFKNHKDYHVTGACQNAIRKIKGLPVR